MSCSFCIIPFKSLNITPGGGVKTCCAFMGYVGKDGAPMSVYEHSLNEIWNSESLRDIRRAMIAGKTLPGCEYCYQQERDGMESMRVSTNNMWQRELDASDNVFEEKVKDLCSTVQANDYNMPDRPEWLDLDVGNLCNLKCRMCNSYSSSGIAADPVHSRWAYNGLIAARWQGAGLVIAPDRLLGVASEGIAWPVVENDVKVGWTDGNAGLRFSTGGVELSGLSIRLSANRPANHPLKLSVNNRTIFDGVLPSGPWQGAFALDDLAQSAELEIRLESALFPRPELGGSVGVGIEEVKLLRRTGGKNEINTSRFPGEGLWFQQKDFLFDELLAQPEKITHLRFIGGEPLLIKEVVTMMRRLIETGAASNITLWTITNGTIINEEYLDLAQRFKSCDLMLSLDGIGAVNDYIRFPGKWDVIDKNIARFKKM